MVPRIFSISLGQHRQKSTLPLGVMATVSDWSAKSLTRVSSGTFVASVLCEPPRPRTVPLPNLPVGCVFCISLRCELALVVCLSSPLMELLSAPGCEAICGARAMWPFPRRAAGAPRE
eukprot:171194-Prymnesium_polylepis.1